MRTNAALSLALCLACAPLGAEDVSGRAAFDDRVEAGVAKHRRQPLEIRHRIHQNPELGDRERETARLVAGHLTCTAGDSGKRGTP